MFHNLKENGQILKRKLQMKMDTTRWTKEDGRVKMDKRKMDIRTSTKEDRQMKTHKRTNKNMDETRWTNEAGQSKMPKQIWSTQMDK